MTDTALWTKLDAVLPDWYVNLSAATGAAFPTGWTNADVVAVAFITFAGSFLVAAVLAANWPSDIAFLALVAGGLLVTWPAMIVLTMAAVVWAMVISALHSTLAPKRSARITAEANRQVASSLDRFAREAGLPEAERSRLLEDVDAEQRRP